MTTRAEMLHKADAILKANPEQPASVRVRYRGGRPAMKWLAKHDEKGAAALWLFARDRLPPAAANDNAQPTDGMGVDRRQDGKPRGKNPDPRGLDAYLSLPAVKPRLGDAEPDPVQRRGWDGESRGIAIKPQREVFDFHPDCRFGFCAAAIADGAIFLGAIGGLGRPKPAKGRGDIRRVDAPELPTIPADVESVLEEILAGGDLGDIGRMLGARGGYADRRGRAAVLAAAKWAKQALAA